MRQPLQAIVIKGGPHYMKNIEAYYLDILKEELNVKEIKLSVDNAVHLVAIDTNITPELRREGLMREIIRHVQQARKQADLEVDDRINLSLESTNEEINNVLDDHILTEIIKQETLSKSINEGPIEGFKIDVTIEVAELSISLLKD